MDHIVELIQRYLDREHAVHELDTTETTRDAVHAAVKDQLASFYADKVLVAREFDHTRLTEVEASTRIQKRNDLAKRPLFAIERFGDGKEAVYRVYLGGTSYYTRDGFHRALAVRDGKKPTIVSIYELASVQGPIAWENRSGELIAGEDESKGWGKAVEGIKLLAPTDEQSLDIYNAMPWPKRGPDAEPGTRPTRKEHEAALTKLYESGTADELRAYLEKHPTTVAEQESWLYDLVGSFDRPDLVEVFVQRIGREIDEVQNLVINAAKQGRAKSLRVLWRYLHDVNARNTDNDTVLTVATRLQQLEAVDVAIAGGANLNDGGPAEMGQDIEEFESDGNWPLVNAVRAKNERLVGMLLAAAANPNLKTSHPRSILEMAEEVGHAPVIELLRAKGAGALSPDTLDFDEAAKNGATARMLELAPAQDLRELLVSGGSYGRIELIDHAAGRGEKLEQKHLDDALYYAAQNGHPAVAVRLLELGASPNTTERFTGQSP